MFDLDSVAREIRWREAQIEKLMAEIRELQFSQIFVQGESMSYADWIS